ncbi:MAG: tRNA threonylcarbamoyladenosine dehydratase [Oscillospiraceae bacterium]|nr:tRNA threonylcarbamoyladenosine dehydratase [Oscillospiraceae bacterium]
MDEQFSRTQMLLGTSAMERLQHSHVAVFGLGGVGSWCAEALCRSGVGRLTLIDQDEVSVSNINRQAEALHSTVGTKKTEALVLRLRDINPNCILHPVAERYESDTRERFFSASYDYIVDAIDLVSCKLDLIETAHARGIPIISALGTGNKTDAQQLRISDISKTEGCPLARVIRKELRNRGIHHHRVVFSPELAHSCEGSGETPPPGRRSIPASSMWVPASAGLLLAQAVILQLAGVEQTL